MQKLWTRITLGVLLTASGIAGCAPIYTSHMVLLTEETSPAAPTSQAPSSGAYSALEQSVHQQINQYRQSGNLPPLTFDERISEQARAHSEAMASGSVPFSHQGFEQRVQAIGRVIAYTKASENVAFNQGYKDPAKQAVEGWLKSPGHLSNIEGSYNLTGIGVAKNAKGEYYFTQIFIRSR